MCLEPPRAYPELGSSASIRSRAEDFRVDEELGFEPAGFGEHLYLQVRKRQANTRWVAQQLASHYAVRHEDVGYAGLKDRHAVTTQWFSVRDPGHARHERIALADVEVLRVERHARKLRPGAHRSNRFHLTLRDATFDDRVEARLVSIARHGVPNYFGPQRFGRNGQTLIQAVTWLAGGRSRGSYSKEYGRSFKRGLYLSAARAWLFNRVLAMRVRNDSWRMPLDGDVLEGSAPTGPLWGRGRSSARGKAAQLEESALADIDDVRHALEHVGLMQQRRSLVLIPENLRYARECDDVFSLRFELPPGGYATVVLRELMGIRDRRSEKES